MQVGDWIRIKANNKLYDKTFGGDLGVIRKIFPSIGTAIVDIVNEHEGTKQINIDMEFLRKEK